MELLADLIGTMVGYLAAGFIVYNFVKFILFRFMKEKNVYIYSFILSCILVVLIYSILNGFVLFNIYYVLALVFLFLFDWIRWNKREKASLN